MLGDFNFLDHLPQRRAITRAIFTDDPHLLGAFGLRKKIHTMKHNDTVCNIKAGLTLLVS